MLHLIENVWDYPRPPALQRETLPIRITFAGRLVAETKAALRVLETSHPPVYYLPPDSFLPGVLIPASGTSFCEWKGLARYWSVRVDGRIAERVGWSYPDPTPNFAALQDHVAVYAGPMDECRVGEELAVPQPGGFYGGWITSWVRGPFKGRPGSTGW
jgi:uncharacterized protein (DUF427 family)